MTNVKLYRDGAGKPACFHCHYRPVIADDLTWVEQGSDPATPTAGEVVMYAKTDGRMYRKDDTGTVKILGPPSGADTWVVAATGCICPTNGCSVCHNGTTCVTSSINLLCARTDEIGWGKSQLTVFTGDKMIIKANVGFVPLNDNTWCTGATFECSCEFWATNQNVASDCNLKKDFSQINCSDVLECYSQTHVYSWQWKHANDIEIEDFGFSPDDKRAKAICRNALRSKNIAPDTKKHIGPMAHEFNNNLGWLFDQEETAINLSDYNGVQHAVLSELSNRIKKLKENVKLLKK